jgi:hypothetical protein
MNQPIRKRSFFDNRIARVLTVGSLTFLTYASWAAYSNWDHGIWIAGRAAAVQGITFGVSATCSASLMELLFKVSRKFVIRYLASSLGSGVIVFFGFLTLHLLNGTPHILMTMLPPIVLATPYYALYPLELTRRELRNDPAGIAIDPVWLRSIVLRLTRVRS